VKPMELIRKDRRTNPYTQIPLRTSNLFSRISQSSFNWRSIGELSDRLEVPRNQYHICSYVIGRVISSKYASLTELGVFLAKHGISTTDLDRIIRYNCISDRLETAIVTKRKTLIRKVMNGYHRKTASLHASSGSTSTSKKLTK
jgi:hypothetical protein